MNILSLPLLLLLTLNTMTTNTMQNNTNQNNTNESHTSLNTEEFDALMLLPVGLERVITLKRETTTRRKSSSPEHTRSLSLDSSSSEEGDGTDIRRIAHRRTMSDTSGNRRIKSDTSESDDIPTLMKQLNSTLEENFFPALVRCGSMPKGETVTQHSKFVNAMTTMLSPLPTPERKHAIRNRLGFFKNQNALSNLVYTNKFRAAYYTNDIQKLQNLIATSSLSPEELHEIFLMFHKDVREKPLSAYLESKISIVQLLLQHNVCPATPAPCYSNDNILLSLFQNPHVTNTLEITHDGIAERLIPLIGSLVEHGLKITHKNEKGYNLLDLIALAKQSIASCDDLKSLSPEDAEFKCEEINWVFGEIMAITRNVLQSNQTHWQHLYDAMPSRLCTAPAVIQIICGYLGLFNRQSEVRSLELHNHGASRAE